MFQQSQWWFITQVRYLQGFRLVGHGADFFLWIPDNLNKL
jgi:hypothetical protein